MIKEWRKNEGLTQAQAAKRLGVSLRTLGRWESQGTPLAMQTVIQLALGHSRHGNEGLTPPPDSVS